MKITVAKAPEGAISLAFDNTKVTLTGAETKTLLLELTKVLLPEGGFARTPAKRAEEFVRKIKGANDLGIQKLLRVAEHDDLLVLLKVGEADRQLTAKIYGNMTEKSRKIFVEDLAYRFESGVADDALVKAISRLTTTTRELEDEGTLKYGT